MKVEGTIESSEDEDCENPFTPKNKDVIGKTQVKQN